MATISIDDELIALLKQEFTSEEQQKFLENFQQYLCYNQSNDHVIDLDDVYEWIGFVKKQTGKIFLLKHCILDTDYSVTNSLTASGKRVYGGQNKEKIMMSISTFKSMCIMANTERGKSTRAYYIKMEEILFKYMANKQQELLRHLDSAKYNEERLKHNTFLATLDKKRIIYLTRVKRMDDGKFIVKLGWSNGLADRNRSHALHFGESMLLDVFECNQNSELELFLKRHTSVAKYAYTDVIVNDIRSSETYLVSQDEYQKIIDVIKKNIKYYQGFSEECRLEMERINLSNRTLDMHARVLDMLERGIITNETATLMLKGGNVSNNVQDQETTSHIENDTEPPSLLGRTGTGRKFQQYDENLKLVETFTTIMEIIRKYPNMSKFGIKHAVSTNTLYHGYRWYAIGHKDEVKEYQIPATVEKQSSLARLVAMLNKDKTKIEKVFSNQQEAMLGINIKRKQTINNLIKTGRLYKNTLYFAFYDDCSEELKAEFTSRETLPNARVSRGTQIQQLDANTKCIVHTFTSMMEAMKHACISRASLKGACDNNEVHGGYLWRYVTNDA